MSESKKEKLKVQVWIWSRNPSDQKAQVLMLKMRQDRGGYWQPVTGGVEPEDQDLEAAALRELREETGLEPLRTPKALGFEFTFQSRWGGTCRESVFETEVAWGEGKAPVVRIDPAEHVDSKWMAADEAGKLLQFESNVQPLEILKKTRLHADTSKGRDIGSALKAWTRKTGVAILLGLCSLQSAFAVQDATSAVEGAEVRKEPRSSAESVGQLFQGQAIRVSEQPVRDLLGNAWYRTKVPNGAYGYINVRDIHLSDVEQLQQMHGIDPDAGGNGYDPSGAGWTISARGLYMGAAEFLNYSVGTSYEGELAVNLGWGSRGYSRRKFALGGAYVGFGDTSLILGSFVTRLYSDARAEPEVRVRGGIEMETGAIAAGVNLAMRLPFSLVAGAHFSGYVEGAGLMIFRESGANAVPIASLGVGLALHL